MTGLLQECHRTSSEIAAREKRKRGWRGGERGGGGGGEKEKGEREREKREREGK